jgi:Fe-S-cluster containining protein
MTGAACVFTRTDRISRNRPRKNAPPSMTIENRTSFLDRAYGLYEEFAGGLSVACKPGCCFCCTRDVAATTLEAYRIFQALGNQENLSLIQNIMGYDEPGFRPLMTTNALAGLCASGEEIPCEDHPVSRGKCLFLSGGLCSIYEKRPFGCRCFVSARNCGENQCAEVEPYVLTVNTVFMQIIEQVDNPGLYGNFSDVLGFIHSEPHRKAYEAGRLSGPPRGLCLNRPIPVLMVPPEHRDRIRPLLTGLQNL